MINNSKHSKENNSFQFFGKEVFGISENGYSVLKSEEYLKRKFSTINSNKKEVGNILDSDIDLLGNKEQLVLELGEILNSDWKEIYKTQSDYGVEILHDGSITPRNKITKDEEWIKKNGGINIVDIANTNFENLPKDWKKENIDAAESALGYFIRNFQKSKKIDKDFIDQFSLYNHNEWLKRNGRIFEEKKDSVDYYKDYNNGIEKEKDIQISKKVISFYAEKLLTNELAKQGHIDWLEIYKTQESDGEQNYNNGLIKPRFKVTKDQVWIKNNGGTNIVDIANTDFDDLPMDWKEENLISAKETIDSIFHELSNGIDVEKSNIIEKLASENHELWKKRNNWIYDNKDGNPKLAVRYSELDEKEKEKNIVIIKRAISIIKENGLLYKYNNSTDVEFDRLNNTEFKNINIFKLFKGYKNESNRGNIINILNSYLLNEENNIEELKSDINNLDFPNLIIYYNLLKDILKDKYNKKLEDLLLYIEAKYDNNLLFRYFRFFSRTRFEILKDDIIAEKNKIIEKYGNDFYLSEGKDYNLRYISNDIIAFSDENKNIDTPLFYYKISENDGRITFKKIFADDLLEGYSFFNDMENSQEIDYSFLIQIVHNPLFLKQIEQQFGFNFNEIPFYLQPRFIKFLYDTNFEDFDRVKTLFDSGKTKEQKFDRLNSFIGTYNNKEFSDIILKLGESDLLDEDVKNELFERYSNIVDNIEELTNKTYSHYLKISNGSNSLKYDKVRENFIEYASSLFFIIDSFIDKGEGDLSIILSDFNKFSTELNGLFYIIKDLDVGDIEGLELGKIPHFSFNKLSNDSLNEGFSKSTLLSKQIKSIVTNQFSLTDLEAFENDFLTDDSSEIFTLESEDGIVLYMVGTKKIGNAIYIDWLAKSDELKGFNLKLTENFLKEQLNLGNITNGNIEALGEPKVLTSFLFIEKFGFIVNGTSDTPESGNYGKEGKYLMLQKDSSINIISKGKNIKEIEKIDSLISKKFLIPEDSNDLLNVVSEMSKKGYIMSRMINQGKQGTSKLFYCVFEEKTLI